MNINKMSVQELKALAYDILVQMENCKSDLEKVNSLIRGKSNVTDTASDTGAKEGTVGEPEDKRAKRTAGKAK